MKIEEREREIHIGKQKYQFFTGGGNKLIFLKNVFTYKIY
jgi:hypothetical protein